MIHHHAHPAHLAADFVTDEQHADDDDNHLQKVGDGHRPHAAEKGVDKNSDRAYPHSGKAADLTGRHHVEHEA